MQKNAYKIISKDAIVMFFVAALGLYLFIIVPQFLSLLSYSYSESLAFYFEFINPLNSISDIVEDGKYIFAIYLLVILALLLLSITLFVVSIKTSRVFFVVLTHVFLLMHFLLILPLPFVASLFYAPN